MRRVFLVLAVLVAASLALTASTASAKVVRPCIPNKQAGLGREGTTNLVLYCGSAKLTIKSAGKTTKWGGNGTGMCLKLVGDLVVGFGEYTTTSSPKAIHSSLVLIIPAPSDGTYKLGTLQVQHKGQATKNAANVHAVIKSKRSRGTFSGTFLHGAKFSGSFTCK
jgi:hypothetical protein